MTHYNIYYITMNTYIETIGEIQKIEEVIIKDSKLKRCCNSSLETVKIVLKDLKNLKHYDRTVLPKHWPQVKKK